MKRNLRKAWSLLLTLVMLVTMFVSLAGNSLAADPELTATLDQAKVYVSDTDQTVRMTVNTDSAVSVCGIGMTAALPAGLTLAGYENGSASISFAAGDCNLDTGKLSWMDGNLNNVETSELATLIVTVPAGTAAGEYTITAQEIKALADNGATTVISGKTVSAVLTVADADAENAELSAALDKPSINISGEDQTVKMTVSTAGTIRVCGIGMTAALPAGLTLAGYENNSANISFAAGDYNLDTGKLSWMDGNLNDVETSELATLIVTVPGGTAAGEYTITAQDIKVLAANGTKTIISDKSVSATLTVVDPSVATGVKLDKETLTVGVGSTATLTAALLPGTTTDSIASAVWTSDNTAAATVENGVVTGVAVGTANITVNVTTAAGKTFTSAPCAVTVANSPYTMTVSDGVDGTAKVHPTDPVTMTVKVSGAAFRTAGGVVTFDPALFTLGEVTSAYNLYKDTATAGQVKFSVNNDADIAAETAILSLSFTANTVTATATGTFDFDKATADAVANLTGDALSAAAVTDDVTVLAAFTVTYQVDGQADVTETVYDGEKPVNVPADPTKDYHTFDGWTTEGSTTTLSKTDIEAAAVTADVTYTAQFTPKSYTVTLPDDGSLTGDPTATYGTDYKADITDYDPDDYEYEVTYTVTDPDSGDTVGTGTASVDATTGKATVTGDKITGNLTLTVTKTLKSVTVEVVADYVTGYTLVTVYRTDSTDRKTVAYSYGGNDMYYVEAYDAYAWIVEGGKTVEEATAEIDRGAAAGTISAGNDVNGTGTVDNNDVALTFQCYKVYAPVAAANMQYYLRADVDGSKKVNMDDISAVFAASVTVG